MRRPAVLVFLIGTVTLIAFWSLLQTPGSLSDALSHPFRAILGTEEQLNSTLLEASENGEPVRAASRRLLQPLGMVRLVRIYETTDPEPTKKH